jgi:LysM domain
MSVLTTGKPNGPTRAAAPARQRAEAAGRGQAAGGSRPARRRQERPGPGVVRHLRVVPDTGLVEGTGTGTENERLRGAPAVREAGPVRGTPAVPGPRQPGDAYRPGDARRPGAASPSNAVRRPGAASPPNAARRPGDPHRPDHVRRPGDVRRAPSAQGLRPDGVPDMRLAPRRNTVRLTRRGRIVVAVMLTAASLSLVVLAWLAIAAKAAQAADGGSPPGAVYQNLTSVVVHPGQTLWSIASQAEPTADPRAVMQQIIDLNGLRGTSLEPGQRLWVPRG